MKIALIVFLVASIANADVWYKVHVNQGKVVSVSMREKPGKHVLESEEYPADAVLPRSVAYKYWKKSGSTWVEMSQIEKDAVDDAEKEDASDFFQWSADIEAFVYVFCEEANISTNQMKMKIKDKIKLDKIKQKPKE